MVWRARSPFHTWHTTLVHLKKVGIMITERLGVVHPFTKCFIETSLFPFEHVAQWFQWIATWSWDSDHDDRWSIAINGFLGVFRFSFCTIDTSIQLKQTCQNGCLVNHTIEVVQVRGMKRPPSTGPSDEDLVITGRRTHPFSWLLPDL